MNLGYRNSSVQMNGSHFPGRKGAVMSCGVLRVTEERIIYQHHLGVLRVGLPRIHSRSG